MRRRRQSDPEAAEAARLDQLAAEGRVVELADVAPTAVVIRVAIGFGDEYWVVEPDFELRPREQLVDGGRLIVDRGVRVTRKSSLHFLENPIEHWVYTT